MDRDDIRKTRVLVPELNEVWEHKILQLEKDRERAWEDLRRVPLFSAEEDVDRQAEAAYKKIHRLDRSITFLDRALLHLADLERGTHYADDLPIRP